MGCSFFERIGSFFDGELKASDRAAFEAHLPCCSQCTLELERMENLSRAFTSAMQAALQSLHPRLTCARLKQRKLLQWSKRLAFAASFFFAVSGSLLLMVGGNSCSAAEISWQQTAIMQHSAATAQIEAIDPLAQTVLRMRP